VVLRADSGLGFLPILLLWGVLLIAGKVSQAAKKAQRRGEPAAPEPLAEKGADPTLLSELHRAMEELRRTEAAQAPRREPAFMPRVSRPSLPSPSAAIPLPTPTPAPTVERSAAFARLDAMKQVPGVRGPVSGIGAAAAAAPGAPTPGFEHQVPVPRPLSRFSDGTPRSAVVLAEILARPRSESL
jgi:hypothetical protein